MLQLIYSRRFVSFMFTQAFGAFNDNLFRGGLIMLITFHFAQTLEDQTASMIALCSAVFVFPFFILSATAGRLADRMDASRLIRILKWSECIVMLLAAAAFWVLQLELLLVMLFFMGAQSAFFGPVKYAIIPRLVKKNELVNANAWVEATTFIAILAGTLLSSTLMLDVTGRVVLSAICIVVAILGIVSSYGIPALPAAHKTTRIRWNIMADTFSICWAGLKQKPMRRIMLAIAWFWATGSVILSQLPHYANSYIMNGAQWVPWLLGCFTIGIGGGSFLCARLLKGELSFKYVPISCIIITLASIDLMFAATNTSLSGMRTMIDIAALSIAAGMFIVPLYATIQHQAEEHLRGRTLAASNILNALAMTLSAIMSILCLQNGIALNIVIAILGMIALLPFLLLRNHTDH